MKLKYSVGVKFIAIILCACSLVAVAFSGIGIAFMEGYDLYHTSLEDVQQMQIDQMGNAIAWHYGQDYAAQTLSNAPVELLDQLNHTYFADRQYGKYTVTIYENGEEDSPVESMTRIKVQYTGNYFKHIFGPLFLRPTGGGLG